MQKLLWQHARRALLHTQLKRLQEPANTVLEVSDSEQQLQDKLICNARSLMVHSCNDAQARASVSATFILRVSTS